MTLRQRLELKQTQSLTLTPQLRQALKMLQMPAIDLTAFLASEVEKNPLLELRGPAERTAAPSEPRPERLNAPPGRGADPGAWEERTPEKPSLYAHIAAQLALMKLDQPTRLAAELLAAEIDEAGYLRADPAAVAARLGLPAAALEAGAAALRLCEPTGVGARDLAECLGLQLAEKGLLDDKMRALLGCLDDLPTQPAEKLAGCCGMSRAELDDMLALLRTLDPRPGLRHSGGVAAPAMAEVRARPDGLGGWTVELAPEATPRLLIDRNYAARVTPGARGEARKFLTECARSAAFLTRALDQRARTIVKVAAEIVAVQHRFLEEGAGAMKPLTLREVAEAAEVHESTVSRVVADKFMATPRGLMPLRVFFSAALSAGDGGEAHAAEAVRARLRALIAEEPPAKPLSDDKLVKLLNAEGVEIARRTVAKYREALGIPSSTQRRRRAKSAV